MRTLARGGESKGNVELLRALRSTKPSVICLSRAVLKALVLETNEEAAEGETERARYT